ncbi:MAG: class I SAM-dependent methyltransferase [Chitinivibrionales bacterium]|nr:class I SAM-dependent methyltransferase [Chitinivibrionales bacterium]
MKDFLQNIEKNRNSSDQINFYEKLNEFIEEVDSSTINKMKAFPVYATRQIITRFMDRYEVYKLSKNVPGSIIECGVGSGFGIMAFAHFASIMEPYHYVKKIIGFDTFEGFPELSEKDKTSKANHMKKGGLDFGSFEELQKAIRLHDMNRPLGHIAKVELVKGDICKSLPTFLEKNPSLVVSLLYLDLDLYNATLETLKLLVDRIPKGGIIAFDELNHADYPGETIAAMEAIGVGNLRLRRFDFSPMLAYAIKE